MRAISGAKYECLARLQRCVRPHGASLAQTGSIFAAFVFSTLYRTFIFFSPSSFAGSWKQKNGHWSGIYRNWLSGAASVGRRGRFVDRRRQMRVPAVRTRLLLLLLAACPRYEFGRRRVIAAACARTTTLTPRGENINKQIALSLRNYMAGLNRLPRRRRSLFRAGQTWSLIKFKALPLTPTCFILTYTDGLCCEKAMQYLQLERGTFLLTSFLEYLFQFAAAKTACIVPVRGDMFFFTLFFWISSSLWMGGMPDSRRNNS